MTISDIVALIALFVGLQALFIWFYQRATDNLVRSHSAEITSIRRGKLLLDKNHAAISNCLAEQASLSRLYATLLMRAHSSLSPSIAPKISEQISKYDLDLQRSLHELDLFCPDSVRRESAMRKLAEEFGDLGSLDLLRQCASELYTEDPRELVPWKHCIAQLTRRIESKLRP